MTPSRVKFPGNCATRFDERKSINGSVSAGAASSSLKETSQRCVSAAHLTIAAATWSTNATTSRSYSAKTEIRWSIAENLSAFWKGISVTNGDVRVSLSRRRIRALYDSMSSIYDIFTRYERGSLKKALEVANPRENSLVLEAGFGTGKTLVELAKKVGNNGAVYALDISQNMMERTHELLHRRNLADRVNLILSDAENTPFSDATFDLVFSSYMLDLIDTPTIPTVLLEFKRVLKSVGLLVLVGLSKGSKWYDNMRLHEWVYKRSPSLLGGCRPVLLAPYLQDLGFRDVNREYIRGGHLTPIEIVWAKKGE